MDKNTTNFLLAGVGGQGTLLASDIVAEVGLHAGLDVKKSEVHGMSQRGGAVTSHVRWGTRVASPLCEMGKVDFFIAQEMLEALRWLAYLKPGGTIVLNKQRWVPISTTYGQDVYPAEEHVMATVSGRAGKVLALDAIAISEKLGNRRAANSVLLGILSSQLDADAEDWLAVVEKNVPQKHKEVNRQCFLAGREGDWLYKK